jgi:hypothetical protein
MIIRIKVSRIFDPSQIRVLMDLRFRSPLVCSINTRGGARVGLVKDLVDTLQTRYSRIQA